MGIKRLQKQVERDQKGAITETFAQRKFTFHQNGTVSVSMDICEPDCITERAAFDGEIDPEIFNDIFPQEVLAAMTIEEANGLDTKADDLPTETGSEPTTETEPETETGTEVKPQTGPVTKSGAHKNLASASTVFLILSNMYFI